MNPNKKLLIIKSVHTLVWTLFAGSIMAIPVFTYFRNLPVAWGLSCFVLMEVVILLVNRMRCPLTDVAATFTDDRRDNFDIFLPLWIARYNKQIFGWLYVAGIVYTLAVWLRGSSLP